MKKSILMKSVFVLALVLSIPTFSHSASSYSSAWVYDPNTAFAGEHAQTESEYQQTFSQLDSQGYRLISIDTLVLYNEVYYSSAWIYDPNTAFAGEHDQTDSQYQQTFNQLGSQSYRLISIDTHVTDNQAYYASAWVYDPNTAFQGRHGQTPSEYQQTFNELGSQGYRLISIDTHVINGQVYYASAWVYDPNTAFQGRHGQTESEYQQTFSELDSQGYRLISVDSHLNNNQVYYASAWIYDPNTAFAGEHAQTESEYQQAFSQLDSQGYRLIDISSFYRGDLVWPVDCVPGDGICKENIGYPDSDSSDPNESSNGLAFNCGAPGYTGHQGTDIVLESNQQENGIGVFAAAEGEVLWVFDGKFDECPNANEPDCQAPVPGVSEGYLVCTEMGPYCGTGDGDGSCSWCFAGGNVVVIRHPGVEGVFATRYDHLRKNSILVAPGDTVQKGQKIAEVGSAGHSSEPHLHFEVWGTGFYQLADPWAGNCGPNYTTPLWENGNTPWDSGGSTGGCGN